jgi:hypothetical protein
MHLADMILAGLISIWMDLMTVSACRTAFNYILFVYQVVTKLSKLEILPVAKRCAAGTSCSCKTTD